MRSDQLLKDEVNQFMAVQFHLGEWGQKELDIPKISWPDQQNPGIKSKINFYSWMKIAATLLIIFLFSWASDLQIVQSDNAITFSFGPDIRPDLVDEDIASLVQSAIIPYKKELDGLRADFHKINQTPEETTWNNLKKQLNEQGTKLDELSSMLARFEPVQMKEISEAITFMNEEQKIDLSEMLGLVLEYWQIQRDKDLFKIENAFQQMDRTLTVQKYESDQFLNNLLASINY